MNDKEKFAFLMGYSNGYYDHYLEDNPGSEKLRDLIGNELFHIANLKTIEQLSDALNLRREEIEFYETIKEELRKKLNKKWYK